MKRGNIPGQRMAAAVFLFWMSCMVAMINMTIVQLFFSVFGVPLALSVGPVG